MPIDAYEPCPCGSGKKFKFCCAAATEEIDKVLHYQEKHQTQSSLQVLDRLIATKSDLAWGYVTKASILLNEGEYAEAWKAISPVLEKNPDHPLGIALNATAAFACVGYEKAKYAIYRAFQRCSAAFPEVVGSLSMGIAAGMFSRNKYMSCRQHLAQAMRLVPDQDKQDIFLRLLEFDGNGDLPYPLRSVHQLTPWKVPESAEPGQREELQKQIHRAEALVAIGCFEPAADAYRQMAERDPANAGLWQNVGFCAAWDGDEVLAAEGLHRAAKLHKDSEAAVECETLAQLLDQNLPGAQMRMASLEYRVTSVARLLTLLDKQPRIVRMPQVPQSQEESPKQTATFQFLDRPSLPNDPDLWPELDAIPCSVGQMGIFEDVREREPHVILTALEDDFPAVRELFEGLASEVIDSTQELGDPLPISTAREQAPMLFNWQLPEKMPVFRQSLLEQHRWEKNVKDIWPNTPLAGLGGKTPNEAKGDPHWEIPLRAAIYVLDAFCDQHGHLVDIPATCQTFGVAPPPPIETKPDLPLQSFSAMQLHRLRIPELSDDQLVYVLNRMLLIHHGGVLREVLLEALSRPSCAEKLDLHRAYNTLAELARDRNDRDDTYHWISEGQKHARTGDQAFEKTMRWEMRELSFRAEDPGDPNLLPLVRKLARKYAKKLPKFLEYISSLLAAYGIDPPSDLAEMADEAGTLSRGGIWTPGEQSEDSEQKKIWLPRQS